ncbi:MAG: DUF4031 domain-containing protein [Actinomycetes bacterium]
MAIYVDECRWWHKERHWCHMVSDVSLEELHAFAALLEIPERGFHRDHYDLPEAYREQAVALGATEVTSRELLHRMRAAGLRVRKSRDTSLGPVA